MRIKRIEASGEGLDTYEGKLLRQDEAEFIVVGLFEGSVNNFCDAQSTAANEKPRKTATKLVLFG